MIDHPARDRLVLGLDVPSWEEADALLRTLHPWFATAKVGWELYAAAGAAAFDRVHERGLAVFADLKLHDIPNTVRRAARVLGHTGVEFLNFHTVGGATMLAAGIEGLREGAADAGHPDPVALGVTVLTSDADTSAFEGRLAVAAAAGCDGVVCSGFEIERAHAAGLRTMVPGLRLPGDDPNDQARVMTPRDAAAAGGDWLVLARSVIRAADPEAAARAAADAVLEVSV